MSETQFETTFSISDLFQRDNREDFYQLVSLFLSSDYTARTLLPPPEVSDYTAGFLSVYTGGVVESSINSDNPKKFQRLHQTSELALSWLSKLHFENQIRLPHSLERIQILRSAALSLSQHPSTSNFSDFVNENS